MIKSRWLSGFVIVLFVGLWFLAGCQTSEIGNPAASDAVALTAGADPTETNTVVHFQIILPSPNEAMKAAGKLTPNLVGRLPNVIRASVATPTVTFKLILLNLGNASQPTTTLVKTALIDASGSAQVFFTSVPALTCIGDVQIEGGHIDSYTDFHGAMDLVVGVQNTLTVAPKGSRLRQDFVAHVIEQIVARSILFGKATPGLATRVIQAIMGLNPSRQTAYEDAVALYESLTDVNVVITTPGATGSSQIDLGQGQMMTFMAIPAGSFLMGSPDTEDGRIANEGPQHQVTVSAFSIATTETTQAQYQAVMNSNPSTFTGDLARPVEQVSWWDAIRFANKASLVSGLSPCYTNAIGSTTIADLDVITCNWAANGLRLPTEAEWEYACRGGATSSFYYRPKPSTWSRVGFGGEGPG